MKHHAASAPRRFGRPSGALLAGLLAGLLIAGPAAAQREDDLPTIDLEPLFGHGEEAAQDDVFGDRIFDEMSNEALVAETYELLRRGRYVRARKLTDELLRRRPESIPGHLFLGILYHRSDGNLPLAYFHVRRSRLILEETYGAPPEDVEMMSWHARAIYELADLAGSMGRHQEKIDTILELERYYQAGVPAELGWPLMRLRRYDAARQAAYQALALGDPVQKAAALTALCAIEAEQQRRLEGWEACRAAMEEERRDAMKQPVPFTNAAEAALGMLYFDEAEELMLEGASYPVSGTVANPWLDLTHLYLAEARISEALDSVRRMLEWRRGQPPYIDEQNRTESEQASALFLIVAGHPEKAARITERILDRPDRTGFTSSESEQMESANALVDAMAQRLTAELLTEEASWSSFRDAAAARGEALVRRLRAWSSGRRAASLLASERILLATIRPYLAGSMEIPEWVELELVQHIGPGVAAAAVAEARRAETLPEAEGYFLAFEAEIAFQRGRERQALAQAEKALVALPGSEALIRAQMAAIAAMAARRLGDSQRSLEHFDLVMQTEPGVIRRIGASLPVSFTARGRLATAAVAQLDDSPRFTEAGRGWFRIDVEGEPESGGRACLIGPQGTRYSCAEVTPRAGEEAGDLARRLAAEAHATFFAPRLDLTQADLRSLDGSPTAAGGRASERMRSVLSDITGEEKP